MLIKAASLKRYFHDIIAFRNELNGNCVHLKASVNILVPCLDHVKCFWQISITFECKSNLQGSVRCRLCTCCLDWMPAPKRNGLKLEFNSVESIRLSLMCKKKKKKKVFLHLVTLFATIIYCYLGYTCSSRDYLFHSSVILFYIHTVYLK